MSTQEEKGQTLLNAVERIVAPNDEILRIVASARRQSSDHASAERWIVARQSNLSALAGAVAAAPSLLPGWGTIGVFGTVMTEMVIVLKLETEMCLALAALNGLDLERRDHRQLAYLLAAVGTHEIATGRNPLQDVGAVGWEAVWSYSPREIGKLLLRVLGALALINAARTVGRGLLRAIPVIGGGVPCSQLRPSTSCR
jgi:hypothetical protein